MHASLIAGTAALGGLLFGYDTGVISGALLFLRDAFHLSALMQGVVTSIALAGAAFGAAFAGELADRYGRRPVIFATALIFVAGSLVSALAGNLPILLTGRLVVGLGIGVSSMLAPLYLAETAPAESRGALVSLNQLMITIGIVVSYLVGYGFAEGGRWRWMLGLGSLPGAILAGGMLVLPETPRWLAGHGHLEDARRALEALRGTHERAGAIEAELRQLQADLAAQVKTTRRLPLSDASVRMPLIVGVGLAAFQQVTGINTVIYFAPTIFQAAGLSSDSASILATAGVGVVNVAMTLVAIGLIDRVGRRRLLLTGLAGMAVSLAVLGAAFLMGGGSGGLAWVTAASLTCYVGFFAIGLGPVFWLLISEIFPLSVRGRGMSLATVANWSFNLVVALTFLLMIDGLGRATTFFVYAAMTILAFVFTWRLVPETKGRSLEDVQAIFNGSPAPAPVEPVTTI